MPRQFTLRSLLAAHLALAIALSVWAWLGVMAVPVVFLTLCSLALRHYLSRALFELDSACYDFAPLIPNLCVPYRLAGGHSALRVEVSRCLLQPISPAWAWAVSTAYISAVWAWRADAWIERDTFAQLAQLGVLVFFGLVILRHHYSGARRTQPRFRAARTAMGRTLGECFCLAMFNIVGCFWVHFP